jgi:ATP-binding cassette subfamily B protein
MQASPSAVITNASEFVVNKSFNYDRRSPVRWIISHILRYKHVMLMVVIGATGNAACAFAVPALVGAAFNAVNQPVPDMSLVVNAAFLLLLSQTIRAGLMLSRNFSSETLGRRLERDARDELYANLLGKSMTFHSMYPVGDIMSRATNDVKELYVMFSEGLNMVIGSGMFLVMPLIVSPLMHPQLIIVPLGFIICYFLAIRFYGLQLKPATEEVRETFGDMNTDLAESIEGIETVKGASQETQELAHFYQRATIFRNAFVRQSDIEARFIPLLLLGAAEAAGLFHAVWLYRAGEIGIGTVVAFMGGLQMFGFPTWVSMIAYSQLALGVSAAERILKLIDIRTDLDQNEAGHSASIQGAVKFDEVNFHYQNGVEVLHRLSFEVGAGQTVAVVGQTGAGKSTLTRLINRTYDATDGSVLVDGVDVRNWSLESLRSQISIIEQDIFLFSRSIRENIAFGHPEATQEQIEQAARDAQAHEFIMSFKEGYDTVVGERGVTLSGGQRQRIALARAFLTNPRILILDDSTSAIDSATEDQIQRAILKASHGRTTFLITHRLSQIRWADLIVVVKQGRIVAQGSHEVLLKSSEAYRRIFATYEAPRSVAQTEKQK